MLSNKFDDATRADVARRFNLQDWQGDLLQCFQVETCHGTRLRLDNHTRTVVHAPKGDQFSDMWLLTVEPGLGFLCGLLENTSISLPDRLIFRPFRIKVSSRPRSVTLIEPSAEMYVAAEMVAPEEIAGRIAADRRSIGPWEVFTLAPTSLPGAVQDPPVIQDLARLAAMRPSMEMIVEELARPSLRFAPSLLKSYLIGLPASRGPVYSALLQDPFLARNLAADGDSYLGIGVPDLAAWLEDRDNVSRHRTVPASLDWLAGTSKQDWFSQQCSASLRSKVVPRKTACVIATARNEGVYLLEWIAYHRSLGFEHFFLYSNDNDDGSDSLLSALADAGVITWLDNQVVQHVSPQLKAYAHAFNFLPDVLDYEWALVIDADEFLVLDTNRFRTVSDYLAWQALLPTDAVALNWLMYGTFGALHYDPQQLLIERFAKRFSGVNMHIKCFCRPSMFSGSHAHYPRTSVGQNPVFRDSVGNPYVHCDEEFAFARHPRDDTAWINHYWSKSMDELLVKFSRNRGDMALVSARSPNLIAEDIASRVLACEADAETVEDRRILQCAPNLRSEMEVLRSIPGVQAAVDEATRRFLEKAASLREAIRNVGLESLPLEVRAALGMVEQASIPLTLDIIVG